MTAPSLNTTRSQELFHAAQALMPGGVSSPVRAFKSVGGQPIVFDRVKGPYAWDVDDNKYIDYIGSWGPPSAVTRTLKSSARCKKPLKRAPVSEPHVHWRTPWQKW